MKNTYIIFVVFILLSACNKDNPSSQNDIIASVKIGSHYWSTKNLDVDHYKNGDQIPEVKDSATWANLKTGAWCYYNNDPSLGKIYGKLYNWYAVNDPRGLVPAGWHVPSDAEWNECETVLGGSGVAGGKLKSKGTREGGDGLWMAPNTSATNESGFYALPGGYRLFDATFYNLGTNCNFWSSTGVNLNLAVDRVLGYSTSSIYRYDHNKENGYSIRCIKD